MDILEKAREFPHRKLMLATILNVISGTISSSGKTKSLPLTDNLKKQLVQRLERIIAYDAINPVYPVAHGVKVGCGVAQGWMTAEETFPFAALSTWKVLICSLKRSMGDR